MKYSKNYCEEKGISTSKLSESQRTLYYIAENMKMDKSISEEGYRHFQIAIKALEQQPSEDCISRQAVIDKATSWNTHFTDSERCVSLSDIMAMPPVTPRTNLAETSQDCIRELIREFDNKHPAVFADYMREFNNHPLSEIIEYMWDMHDLLEDIKYRLPDDGGGEE